MNDSSSYILYVPTKQNITKKNVITSDWKYIDCLWILFNNISTTLKQTEQHNREMSTRLDAIGFIRLPSVEKATMLRHNMAFVMLTKLSNGYLDNSVIGIQCCQLEAVWAYHEFSDILWKKYESFIVVPQKSVLNMIMLGFMMILMFFRL